jgi:DNA-binding NarL/FixJ family response regulator
LSDRCCTVLIGKFEPVVRLGLATILSGDTRLAVHECDDGMTALLLALAQWEPQVVILNVRSERETRENWRSADRAPGILVFAHQPTPTYGLSLLALGATCLARNAVPETILAVVHRVAQGRRMFLPENRQALARRYPQDAPPLTPREVQVLSRLSEGKSHKQTAHEMQIGIRTVHTHTARICRKLGAKSKHDLIGMPLPGQQQAAE